MGTAKSSVRNVITGGHQIYSQCYYAYTRWHKEQLATKRSMTRVQLAQQIRDLDELGRSSTFATFRLEALKLRGLMCAQEHIMASLLASYRKDELAYYIDQPRFKLIHNG